MSSLVSGQGAKGPHLMDASRVYQESMRLAASLFLESFQEQVIRAPCKDTHLGMVGRARSAGERNIAYRLGCHLGPMLPDSCK